MQFNKIQSDIEIKGYTQFNLKDFNEEYYNELLPLKCNEINNLKHLMTGIRLDGSSYKPNESQINENSVGYSSFEDTQEAMLAKLKLIKGQPFQNWYRAEYHDLPLGNTIQKIKYDISKKIFSIDESIKLQSLVNDITFFDYGCQIVNHRDGTNLNRICAIIIYLNETYNINDGGILKLDNNEEILPIFGNVVVISLKENGKNVEHQVNKVVGGIGRYAITTFVVYTEGFQNQITSQ